MLTQSQLTETAAQLYREALVASLAQGRGSLMACDDARAAVSAYRHAFGPSKALPMVPTRPGKWWRMWGEVPDLVDVDVRHDGKLVGMRGVLVQDDGSWRGPLLAPGESWAPEDDARLTGLTPADAYRLGFDDARDKRLPETHARRAGPAAVARFVHTVEAVTDAIVQVAYDLVDQIPETPAE